MQEERQDGEEDVGGEWEVIAGALTTTAEKKLCQTRGRQQWMIEEILAKMEERRKSKNLNHGRYQRLDQEIKRDCNREKEKWLTEKCIQVEQLEGRDPKAMFETIRDITGERRPFREEIIKYRDGSILTDSEDVLRRWKEYVEELFDDERGDKSEVMELSYTLFSITK